MSSNMFEEKRDLKKLNGTKLVRQRSINNYYDNPNNCRCCGKIIQIKAGGRVFNARQKKFCNRSCAASFNNRGVRRHGNPDVCRKCGKNVARGVLHCKKCNTIIHWENHNKRKLSDIKGKGNSRIKWSQVRKWANRIMKITGRPYICSMCDFNCKLDVCHIKPINSFSEDTLCGVVNAPTNLTYLCPNHHVLFDRGIIDLNGQIISTKTCNCKKEDVNL